MTAPYAARAETGIRSTVPFLVTATANHPAWPAPVDLPVQSASCTFDEAWSPYIQATADLAPSGPLAALLDPRAGVRVRLDAGYLYDGTTRDVHTLGDLHLRTRPWRQEPSTSSLSLTLASDEALLQDWTPLGAQLTFPAGTPVVTVVRDVVHWRVDPDAVLMNALPSSAVTSAAVVVSTGTDPWAVLADIADQVDAQVYVDGARIWNLTPRVQVAGISRHIVKAGETGTLETLEDVLDRETWGNAVLLTYEGGQQSWAWADSGPLSVTAVPVKVQRVTRRAPFPGADASKRAARSLLRRTLTRGRGQTITAVAALWLRPGMTITVQPRDGEPTRELVSRVTFDLPAGTMTVRTRHPEIDPTIGIGA